MAEADDPKVKPVKEKKVKEPKEKKVKEPKVKPVKEPKEKKVKEPKEKPVKEPKEKKVKEPKEKKVKEPKAKQTKAPSVPRDPNAPVMGSGPNMRFQCLKCYRTFKDEQAALDCCGSLIQAWSTNYRRWGKQNWYGR